MSKKIKKKRIAKRKPNKRTMNGVAKCHCCERFKHVSKLRLLDGLRLQGKLVRVCLECIKTAKIEEFKQEIEPYNDLYQFTDDDIKKIAEVNVKIK